MKEVQKRRW